jgi:hypothetical protein
LAASRWYPQNTELNSDSSAGQVFSSFLLQKSILEYGYAAMNTLSWETDALDYWRLCDELSVVKAALLIVGQHPSKLQNRIDTIPPEKRPAGYDAAKAALMNAINRKRLPAGIVERDDTNSREVDWHRTVVAVEDIKQWLRSRGIVTGFFFRLLRLDLTTCPHPTQLFRKTRGGLRRTSTTKRRAS